MSDDDNVRLIRGSGVSLRVQVYEEIRNRIQLGEFNPADRLVDVDIARNLGTSRMPVREALLRLTHEGYLVGTTRGFMLPTLTSTDVANIFEVRKCLEPRAAAHAAGNLDAVGLAQLDMALDQAGKAVAMFDGAALFRASDRFRTTWLKAIANDRLSSALARFADHVQVVRRATLPDTPTQVIVLADMREMHEAFVRRDAMAAHDRMATMIQHAEDRFIALTQAYETAGDSYHNAVGQG